MLTWDAPTILPTAPFAYKIQKRSIHFRFQKGDYLIKTAESEAERILSYELRASVFANEYGAPMQGGLDSDTYDDDADHLLIFKAGQLVGTYRMLWSEVTDVFYSEEEFDLCEFLARPGSKIELSRACIEPDHRNGSVIGLLWQGIYEFFKQTGADYLFGLSSVRGRDPQRILGLIEQFRLGGNFDGSFAIYPTKAYDPSYELVASLGLDGIPEPEKKDMPPLLRTYLKAGAKLAPVPAFDPDFQCFDFFTILKRKDLNSAFMKRLVHQTR